MEIDYLKLYKGDEIVINDFITIKAPQLYDVIEFGEKKYYSLISTLCATPSDLKWQLDDIGIDYSKIDDYSLFVNFLTGSLGSELSKVIFKNNIDFSKFSIEHNKELDMDVLSYVENKEVVLDKQNIITRILYHYNIKNKRFPLKTEAITRKYTIDRYAYNLLVEYVRAMHYLVRNDEVCMNETTRRILIDDAREDFLLNKDKEYKSFLFPLVSSMVNSNGFKRNDKTVFEMNIFSFMDSVKRVIKIKNSDLLLASSYSGFGVNLKDVKEEVNWTGNLD